jgi:hypothetical protein
MLDVIREGAGCRRRHLVRRTLGLALSPAPATGGRVSISGWGPLVAALKTFGDPVGDWPGLLESSPPLVQTSVPLHPDRKARLLRGRGLPPDGLVALVWSRDSVPAREANARRIQVLARRATAASGTAIVVQDDHCRLPRCSPTSDWAWPGRAFPPWVCVT